MDTVSDVSVVICAYCQDRWDELTAAIASVQMQSLPPREIVVVVDHNRELFERVRSQVPCVVAVESMEPRGLSGARNSGVAATRSEVIAFLDDDAVAPPDWLEQLAAGYEDPRVLGVGGPVEPLWQEGRPRWFPEEFDWVVGCTFRGMPQTSASVRALIGCNMSFQRQIFDAIGGFRSCMGRVGTHPLAGEETEFCIRACHRWPEGKWLYQPRAKVSHRVPVGRTSYQYFRSRCYSEGLSKALLSEFVGTRDGLAAERAYTFRSLPQGIVRGLADAIRLADPAGLSRAGAILTGLTITTAGYLDGAVSGKLAIRRRATREVDPLVRPSTL
jgi:glucosyl-dolichyl phosphate glucuronosyltransferase